MFMYVITYAEHFFQNAYIHTVQKYLLTSTAKTFLIHKEQGIPSVYERKLFCPQIYSPLKHFVLSTYI